MSKKNISPTSWVILLMLTGCSNLEPIPVGGIRYLPSRHHRIALEKLEEITTPDWHLKRENQTLPGGVE